MQDNLQSRFDYVGIDRAVREDVARLGPAIEKHLPAAFELMQARSQHIPTPVRFLFGKEQIEAGRAAQSAQYAAVMSGQLDRKEADFSSKLGQRHARLRIEPRWHLGGYAVMLEAVLRGVIHDELDKALQPRRTRLGLPVARDRAEVMADADALAAGVAGMVKSVLVDIDLVVSAHFAKLSEEAQANEHQVRTRMRNAAQAAGETLRLVAGGKLDQRLSDPVEPEFELVREGANALADRLSAVFARLHTSSSSLRRATAEIQSSTGDLAGSALQQAVGIEQADAMIRELAATLADNAKRLSTAGKAAKGLVQAAASGTEALRAVAEVAAKSGSPTEGMGAMAAQFSDFALKSNLLAVRAAAEAARQGKDGAGLADMATQLRALADDAAEASLKARKLLKTEQAQSEKIGAAVKRAAEAVEAVTGRVTDNAQSIDAVVKAGRQQCDVLEQVSLVLKSMHDANHANAVLGAQASTALDETSLQIEALELLLELLQGTPSEETHAAPAIGAMQAVG